MDIPVQTARAHAYPDKEYIPRGQNVLQALFKDHFAEFKEIYDEKYAQIYGNYRTDRITEVVEEFLKCGDFREGVARIKCQNPKCGHDYFVPLSCLGFYLCPSCHQKRTLLFGEQIAHDVLLRLPHRQFVFAIPKCLRPYFLHNRALFSDISRLIFDLICDYYNEVAGKQITTGLILSHQTFGDFARPNPHWHGLLLEGGFDDNGNFVYLPIASTKQMAELFRRKVIWYFEKNKLLNTDFALNLLSWKNSGFSIDNSVRIYGSDNKARESLAQYIARAPVSLEKLKYEPFHGKVLFKTPKYNDFFKENFKSFDVLDFIALVTAHIPPKHKQYIRRYGLYSSRSRGKWKEHEHLCRLAPDGWKKKQEIAVTVPQEESSRETPAVGTKQQRSAWARLIKKVYGVDPLLCPKCGSDMKIIAIIMNPEETVKILRHLIKTGKSPPGFDPNSLN
jgi:hypothetical protein